MQHTSYFHSNLSLSMDTSSSTKQQFLLSPPSPFQFTYPQNISTQHNNLHPKYLWSNEQKLQYSLFLCYFRDFFNKSELERVEWNVFRGMSRFIQTRNPQQCRSYHLKLISKFKDAKKFLKVLMRRITGIKQKIAKVEKQLEMIQEEFDIYIEKTSSQHLKGKDRQNNSIFTNACLKDRNINLSVTNDKASKEESIRTADNYSPLQNTINAQIRPIHDSKTETYLSDSVKISRQERLSLPSFDDEKNEKMVING